jgi:hypothetical protein
LVVQPAQRIGPLVKLERPWESKGIRFNVVMQDEGKYRAWGYVDVGKRGTPPQFKPVHYESNDGIHWERPNLGQIEFEGSRDNDLYDGYDEATVFKDPSALAEERYKAVMPSTISRNKFDEYRKKYSNANAWEKGALWEAEKNDRVWCIRGGVSDMIYEPTPDMGPCSACSVIGAPIGSRCILNTHGLVGTGRSRGSRASGRGLFSTAVPGEVIATDCLNCQSLPDQQFASHSRSRGDGGADGSEVTTAPTRKARKASALRPFRRKRMACPAIGLEETGT